MTTTCKQCITQASPVWHHIHRVEGALPRRKSEEDWHISHGWAASWLSALPRGLLRPPSFGAFDASDLGVIQHSDQLSEPSSSLHLRPVTLELFG